MTVTIQCYKGRFTLASDRTDWLLQVTTPFGKVSEFFPEEPDHWDACVETALDLIEQRMGEYIFRSSAERDRATIAEIRKNLNACELPYAEWKLARAEAEAADADARVQRIKKTIAFIKSEMMEAAQ